MTHPIGKGVTRPNTGRASIFVGDDALDGNVDWLTGIYH